MYKYIIILFLSFTSLFALNPVAFSQLGDDIYNSLNLYKKVSKTIPQVSSISNNYIDSVKQVKEFGYKVDSNPKLSKEYLLKLRELDKKREVILTKLNSLMYSSMDAVNTKMFKKIIQSKLINFDKVADDVVPFYKRNFKSGSIREIDTLLRNEKRYKIDTKKANRDYLKYLEKRRIQRMRDASKTNDATREVQLDDEVQKEREKINQMVETELIR